MVLFFYGVFPHYGPLNGLKINDLKEKLYYSVTFCELISLHSVTEAGITPLNSKCKPSVMND